MMSSYDRWVTSTPWDDEEPEEWNAPRPYELRYTPAVTNAPEIRGTLIATFETYREAFRRWQEMNAAGQNVYVIRTAD